MIHVVASMDPIKYLLQQLMINENVTTWTIMFLEFDLHYIPHKVIKGRVVSDFLTDLPTEDQEEETFNFF